MKKEDFLRYAEEKEELLKEVGASTVPNAITKLRKERKNAKALEDQHQKVLDALEVDNWMNAVRRAGHLREKVEKDILPNWILVVPPSWCDSEKVSHKDYKKWLRFCQEQFLTVLVEMEEEKKLFPDFDQTSQVNNAKHLFISTLPWEFVDGCSEFHHPGEEAGEESSLIETLVT